jgi:hypothetical protein
MKTNSVCVMTFTGLVLTAALVVAGNGLAQLHPTHDLASLALLVNCGGGFEAQVARTEGQHIGQYSVCLYRSDPVESARSASLCSGGTGSSGEDCGRESAQKREVALRYPDALLHWRL